MRIVEDQSSRVRGIGTVQFAANELLYGLMTSSTARESTPSRAVAARGAADGCARRTVLPLLISL